MRSRIKRQMRFRAIINEINKELTAHEVPKAGEDTRRRYFVQIGAGAGDLDPTKSYDGFSKVVKAQLLLPLDYIILIEPNPLNLEALQQSWAGFSNVLIVQKAITPKKIKEGEAQLYYTFLDKPYYQVASLDKTHVLKHYPSLKTTGLQSISVPTGHLVSVIKDLVKDNEIVLLAMDIEGMEKQIILETDFKELRIRLLSIEHLHLRNDMDQIKKHLEECGFEYIGSGLDPEGFDSLFRNMSPFNHANYQQIN